MHAKKHSTLTIVLQVALHVAITFNFSFSMDIVTIRVQGKNNIIYLSEVIEPKSFYPVLSVIR